MLRGLSSKFYHQVVTTQQVEQHIAATTGLDLTAFFNQYLRTANIPELQYYVKDNELFYKFDSIVPGFTIPIPVLNSKETIRPSATWQHISWTGSHTLEFSKDFLITVK
jgi:aminopeptidase N